MWSYEHARDVAIVALRVEADAQEHGQPERVGDGFEAYDRNLPRASGPEFDKLHIALRFWDEWIYARDHGWRTPVPAPREEWPRLARRIAQRLEADEDVTDPAVLSRFRESGP